MGKTLGQTLLELRNIQQMTLRQVEEAAGISNAYLIQLENDKIKKPSANILYKLAKLYCVDIDVLLFAAGIIKEQQANCRLNALAKQELTSEEEKALLDYLRFLRSKK